jgi:hypothetical protein
MSSAAIAARQRQILMQKEEQEMTKYSDEELNNDWEFKIVRANTALFKDYNKMKEVIDQEKQFNWIFLEKFDDYRLRFKRKRSDNIDKNISPYNNPYRTLYGISTGTYTALILTVTLAGTFGLFGLIFLIVSLLTK